MACGYACAQRPVDSSIPPLQILKLKWEKQVRLPRDFDPALIPTRGTFSDATSRAATGTPQTPLDMQRVTTGAQNTPATPSVAIFPITPGRLPVFYVYSIKVKNRGDRIIDGVAWDYSFLDVTTGAEVGHHQFLSLERVSSDRTVTFRSQLRSPPTRILDAAAAKKQREKYDGRASIQCVLFADDTTWRDPHASSDTCALLRTQRDLRKKKHSANQ